MLDGSDITVLALNPIDEVHGSSSTYGSLMRSIFQMVDINTHLDNSNTPLAGQYRVNPILHSYFGLNASPDEEVISSDGGTLYIDEASESATTAASSILTTIESTLICNGSSLQYPKEFYLAIRENMLSQKIATLVDSRKQAGLYSVNFDATGLSTGLYIYRLKTGSSVINRQMMLIK